MRDDRPFGGEAPPAAVFYYSRDRGGEHPQAHLAGYAGILQADAYDGYGKLYEAGRNPGVILGQGVGRTRVANSLFWPTLNPLRDAGRRGGARR